MPRSANLAGQAVTLSPDIPAVFDAPLAPHHKLIGQWVASRETCEKLYSRPEARRYIERVFGHAVSETFEPISLADLRVVILNAQDERPPAAAINCDSLGQIDLGWIENSDAPIPWRAAAYKALGQTLGCVLPIFGYAELFDEIAMYYWDGDTTDEGARQSQIAIHGMDPADIDEEMMPSAMNGRRPAWMIARNSAPAKVLPAELREALRHLKTAHKAVRRFDHERSAWHFEGHQIFEYIPELEDCSTLPPLTLVPVEQFARELDDVGRHGMETGFVEIAGLCPLTDPTMIDDWFASLRLGAQLILAAQELIQLYPTNE